jgi:hypothetical protein
MKNKKVSINELVEALVKDGAYQDGTLVGENSDMIKVTYKFGLDLFLDINKEYGMGELNVIINEVLEGIDDLRDEAKERLIKIQKEVLR